MGKYYLIMRLNMILYSQGRKLTIRGVIPKTVTDLDLYKKSVDGKGINREFEKYAFKQWDSVATVMIRKMIGEEVVEEKDFPIKSD
ncbi:MAG: hypothetical protein ABWZ25_15265 [Chitinophagaceae bacterium]